jgi:hypothetical protein
MMPIPFKQRGMRTFECFEKMFAMCFPFTYTLLLIFSYIKPDPRTLPGDWAVISSTSGHELQ